jgi:ubiquinone/menaquinone biosynthesis C-methylase UbiE
MRRLQELREITDWEKPIYVKVGATGVFNDVKLAVHAGADVVVVDGMQGGTAATQTVFIENVGIPTLAALRQAVDALDAGDGRGGLKPCNRLPSDHAHPPTGFPTRSSTVNPNKALWEKGDFTRLAQSMRQSGESLVKGLGITQGLKVLDLGCGDGTTALPEAMLGADVLGVDIASNLVEAGNKRAKAAGLTNCKFQLGDACNLQELPDDSFDLIVSMFGAMFAPKPFEVAREMVRVSRSGGRIVMGNWIPNDPTLVAQILKISSAYSPPPPEGFISPMTWGVEHNVIERFSGAGIAGESISFAKDTYTFEFSDTPAKFLETFKNFYGPTMNAFEAAEKNGRAGDLQRELEELFESQNKSSSKDTTLIPATYLRVTVAVS